VTAQSELGFRPYEYWESCLSEYFKLHNEILFVRPSIRMFHIRTYSEDSDEIWNLKNCTKSCLVNLFLFSYQSNTVPTLHEDQIEFLSTFSKTAQRSKHMHYMRLDV
jgi:hypothetical protein